MASPLKVSMPLPLKYSQKRGREGEGRKGREWGRGRGEKGMGRRREGMEWNERYGALIPLKGDAIF